MRLLLLLFVLGFAIGCSNKEIYMLDGVDDELIEKVDEHTRNNELQEELPVEEEEEGPDPEALKLEIESFANSPVLSLPYPTSQVSAQNIINPLLDASYDKLTLEYGLTHAEIIDIFDSANNPEMALVGLALFILEKYPNNGSAGFCNSDIKIVRCALNALLPCSIFDIIQDAVNSTNLKTAWQTLPYGAKKQILKSIGSFAVRNMGGIIGAAVTVADFTNCMLQPTATPEDPETPGVGCPHDPQSIVLNENLLLNTSIMYAYTAYHSHIGHYIGTDPFNYGRPPFPFTYVFLNNSNSKYYMDSSFTKILPDGYYIEGEEISSQSLWKYVRIENGIPVEIALANNPDPYRCLEAFDPATHLPFFD